MARVTRRSTLGAKTPKPKAAPVLKRKPTGATVVDFSSSLRGAKTTARQTAGNIVIVDHGEGARGYARYGVYRRAAKPAAAPAPRKRPQRRRRRQQGGLFGGLFG